ncbi:unnamed protein product [Miscanthus lutarioriparius]|uniref:Uncharacterized protein n=1 Tax=Miscanthus lutarioriparius TaxID=422564 RepID=A0A811Q8X3_9POAL|nr:unnamed protein product [Miscanthus lutarioriparius]
MKRVKQEVLLTRRHRPFAPAHIHHYATCTSSTIFDTTDTQVNAPVKMVFLVGVCAAPDGFSFHLGLLKDETQDEENGDETLELSFAFHEDFPRSREGETHANVQMMCG